MNTKEYIESGILELYVMGKLSEAENREVEQNIAQYPEVKAEVDAIEAAIEEYAMLHQLKSGGGGFDAVLKKLGGNTSDAPKKSSGGFLPFLTIALAALSVLALILFWNSRNTHRAQVAAMQELLDTCDQNLVQAENQIATQNEIILQLQGRQTIYMDGQSPGTNKAPQAIAAVIWNEATNEFAVNPLSLPSTPSNKDYQLWAIVDGNPVDMIVFNTNADPNSFTTLAFTSRPTAFAVTLEPKGGSDAPTLTEMYVLGALQG